MNLIEKLENNRFVITAELCPPKGPDIDSFLNKAKMLKGLVDAVNITDNQRAIMRLSSLSAAYLAQKEGIEAVFQITCRDRNRIALQSDILGAAGMGIHNILALTGDYVTEGDHPEAKPVFDLDSVLLIKAIDNFNHGYNMAGRSMNGKTDFFIGAAVNPEAEPSEPQLLSFRKKIAAGARFFQTQAVYDIEVFARFMDYAKDFPVKIIAGILLIKSPKMARFLNENVPGVRIPQRLVDRINVSSDPMQTGIEIAREQIAELRPLCHGAHIMTVGAEERVRDIVK